MSEPGNTQGVDRVPEGEVSVASAEATANIAFIKYWGAKDLERAIPSNPSISMTLRECRSRCTARFHPGAGGDDEILLETDGELRVAPESFSGRIRRHLDRLRQWGGRTGRFRIETANSFPAAAGMASSASGFAALTLAVTASFDEHPDEATLSRLARLSGSGSAARSVMGGYVEWPAGEGEDECYARRLLRAEEWELCDVIAVVESGAKEVSSLDGHRRAPTSPYFERRQELLPGRLAAVRQALERRDFTALGEVVEEEAIDLHLIAMSSRPPIYYWKPATVAVLERVRRLRDEGVEAYSTMDAGANVHVICQPQDRAAVAEALAEMPGVQRIIRDGVGGDPSVRAGE